MNTLKDEGRARIGFEGLVYDEEARQLRRGENALELTRKAFDLLGLRCASSAGRCPRPPARRWPGWAWCRGRVTESGRPAPGAAVTVERSRRVVPVAPDGSFEARLLPGTYLVVVRPGGQPEATPVEIKVAVAAGTTVDLGTVALSGPPRAPAAGGGR